MDAEDHHSRLARLNAAAVFMHYMQIGVLEAARLARVLTPEEYADLCAAGQDPLETAATRQRVGEIRLAAKGRVGNLEPRVKRLETRTERLESTCHSPLAARHSPLATRHSPPNL